MSTRAATAHEHAESARVGEGAMQQVRCAGRRGGYSAVDRAGEAIM